MIINTRQDLDAIKGTPAHAEFISKLKASLTRPQNTQIYPEGYDSTLQVGAEGYLPPIWEAVPDDSAARRFGYTAEELATL